MKVRIKTYNGSLVGYLSTDKVYDVVRRGPDSLAVIVNDVAAQSIIRLPNCYHLNGGSWEIVND